MSEKTLGQVLYEAQWPKSNYGAVDKTSYIREAAGIAAVADVVARRVFAEGMAAYLAEQDKPVEPPKPEAADDAGDWADATWTEARRLFTSTMKLNDSECAAVIREAAERHYGERITQLQGYMLALADVVGASYPSPMTDATLAANVMAATRKTIAERDAALRNRCDNCGANTVDNCIRCGAPQCCPQCCKITTLCFEYDAANERIKKLEAERDALRESSTVEHAKRLANQLDAAKADNRRLLAAMMQLGVILKPVLGDNPLVVEADVVKAVEKLRQERDAALAEVERLKSECTARSASLGMAITVAEALADERDATQPDERSCLAALMHVSGLLGMAGIVNPGDCVKGVGAMKAERDKLASELREVREAMVWSSIDSNITAWSLNSQKWGVWSCGKTLAMHEKKLDAILAAFRATKGKEHGDGK